MLKHMSQYEADTDQKCAFQVMFEQYNHEEKLEREHALKKCSVNFTLLPQREVYSEN